MGDPLPLSPQQLWTLIKAAARQLLWGLRAVSKEVHAWQALASRIPDPAIREDALSSLRHKRENADGAALFWILTRRRDSNLLRLLVAYQIIWDFLDSVSERGACEGTANGRQLHRALVEALDPSTEISDYYRYHPWRDDGGYLRALVQTCRASCTALPSYGRVKPLVVREAGRAQVQALNHDSDPVDRDEALREWVAREFASERRFEWFELSSAASASLAVHAFLAIAAEPGCSEQQLERTYAAYFPWISGAATMLDSYVDQVDDAASENHCYLAHYESSTVAGKRVRALVERSTTEARRLRDGHRHAVIASSMIAMYLSKGSARTPQMRASTASLARAGGSLTRLLLPILRLWRITSPRRSC